MKTKALLLACLVTGACYAQEAGEDEVPKNKNGHEILPKEGDIGLGFNTIPILNFFMDAVTGNPGGSGSNVVGYTHNVNNQITGKYFLKRKLAVRARVGVNSLSGSITNRVQDSRALYEASLGTPEDVEKASNLRVEDVKRYNKNNIIITVGIEQRRGYRRLQGYYGGEVGFGSTGASETITYGNPFSDQYDVHFTSNFEGSSGPQVTVINPIGSSPIARTTEVRHRGGIRVGVRGFIGIEYFVFPKISIAAEYGWGYSLATQRAVTSTESVYLNGQNGPTVYEQNVDSDASGVHHGFSVDNNNGNVFSLNNTIIGNTALSGGAGALTLLFHF